MNKTKLNQMAIADHLTDLTEQKIRNCDHEDYSVITTTDPETDKLYVFRICKNCGDTCEI